MDNYGYWLWLALFAAGGATSVFSWLAEFFARRRREALDVILTRLQKILAEARECQTQQDLQRLTLELDKLVSRSIAQTRKKATTAATMGALMISIESARHAIGDQRRRLVDEVTHSNGGWNDTAKRRRLKQT